MIWVLRWVWMLMLLLGVVMIVAGIFSVNDGSVVVPGVIVTGVCGYALWATSEL